MAIPQLKAIIGADGKPLQKTLAELKEDIKSFKKELDSAKDPAYISKLNRNLKEAQTNIKNLEAYSGKAKQSISSFATGLVQGLGIAVFQQATAAASEFFQSSINEALEAQRSVENFRQTLESVGRSDLFSNLTESANEFQKQFQYLDNDDITSGFTKLIQLGGLTEKQLKDLIPVIIDLNAKQRLAGEVNKSVADTADEIVKAMAGSSRELKKYGIEIDASMSQTEKLNLILGTLGQKVKGAGDAFKDSFEGQIAISTQRVRDLQEELGQKLLPLKAGLINFALQAGSAFEKFYQFMNNTSDVVGKTRKEIDALTASKKKAKEFAANASNFLQTAPDGDFEKWVRAFEDKADAAAKILADGSKPLATNHFKQELQHNRDIVEALREQRRVVKDNRTLGAGAKGDTTGSSKEKVDLLKQQLETAKKLAAVYPNEGSLLDSAYNLELKMLIRDSSAQGLSSDELQILKDGLQAKLNTAKKAMKTFEGTIEPISIDFSKYTTDVQSNTSSTGLGASFEERFPALVKRYKEEGTKAIEAINAQTVDLSAILQGSFAEIGVALGESLSIALSPGATAGDIAKPVLMLLADVVVVIGKAFIQAGIEMKAAKEAIAALFSNPATAIIAGIGLIALGTLLKAQLSKQGNNAVKRFAVGGVVTGPTNALIGEQGKPEAVLPLDRIPHLVNRMNGGSGGNGILEARISGDDIVFIYDTRKKKQNRYR